MIAREEIKYLEAAMKAISTNSGLQSKFGSGFEGVQELANIIKQRQSQRVFESVLEDVLENANSDGSNKATAGKFDLNAVKKSQNYIKEKKYYLIYIHNHTIMQSYSVKKFLESQVANESHRYSPSSQSLSHLKNMDEMTKLVNTEDSDLAKVSGESMKYNSASVSAIANNPGLQARFGGGLSGVDSLENQLQQHQAKRVFESVMDDVLEEADQEPKRGTAFNIEKTKKRLGLMK